ncbi:hypothetical protein MZI59_19345, partial [Escherichia coli]|nr:hypothetical protein [Escherichia coli]
KNRHSYPVSISVILFNSRFRSYGAQGVLKKHPFCGAFLVFWGFKFLSMDIIFVEPEETDQTVQMRRLPPEPLLSHHSGDSQTLFG